MNITYTMSAKCIVLLLSGLFAGCGGGGDGDGGGSGGGGIQGANDDTNNGTQPSLSVRDLKIDSDNDLSSVYQVDVDVDISARSTARAFISICDNSDANGELKAIDFDNCMIKGRLDQGIGQYDLRVANHCTDLIAVIWIMEKDRDPLSYTLKHDKSKEQYWGIR